MHGEGRGCIPCILTLRNIVARGFLFESPPFVVMFVRGLTLCYILYCYLRHCSMTLWWLLGWSNVIFYVKIVNTNLPTKWNAPPLLHYDFLLQCDHVLALPLFIQIPFHPTTTLILAIRLSHSCLSTFHTLLDTCYHNNKIHQFSIVASIWIDKHGRIRKGNPITNVNVGSNV